MIKFLFLYQNNWKLLLTVLVVNMVAISITPLLLSDLEIGVRWPSVVILQAVVLGLLNTLGTPIKQPFITREISCNE